MGHRNKEVSDVARAIITGIIVEIGDFNGETRGEHGKMSEQLRSRKSEAFKRGHLEYFA